MTVVVVALEPDDDGFGSKTETSHVKFAESSCSKNEWRARGIVAFDSFVRSFASLVSSFLLPLRVNKRTNNDYTISRKSQSKGRRHFRVGYIFGLFFRLAAVFSDERARERERERESKNLVDCQISSEVFSMSRLIVVLHDCG